MTVLLLARGDQESKMLLRHAIEARYGMSPQAIDTLKLEVKGRTRMKIGPVATWIPLDGIAYFKFPFSVRWNFTMHPVGVLRGGGEEAFDGAICRKRQGNEVAEIKDSAPIKAAYARLWAVSALLLMPLSEHFVELRATGARSLDATHVEHGLTAHLNLNDDHTLDSASAECVNPVTKKVQSYSLRLSEGQKEIGGMMLPGKIAVCWDEQPEMEVSPVSAEINPAVDEGVFRLA
jgi:hypothetical protein